MMFCESRNDRRRRIGARAISAEIGDNSADIGDGAAGIVDIGAKSRT